MRRCLIILAAALGASVAGCSGGGTSSPPSAPQSLAGAGTNVAFNQKISFSIEVPAPAAAGASVRRQTGQRRVAVSATAAPTTPYVSPATAAVVLTIAEVNGVSPQKAPPPIAAIPVTCTACTFSAPNIPAALGIDRYFVQTYSGFANGQAAGNLISTGFVDVAVPVKTPPAIGGAAVLSIGGYVAQISLAPVALSFMNGVAGDADILVRALDAGGATIIGAVQYVSPIVVNVVDAQNFSVDGAATETIAGTLQKPIVLHYTGGNSFGTLVQATSQNENGITVSATPVAASVVVPTPAPGVSPTPMPSPTLPPARTSLYVADAGSDTVSEYGFVTQLEAGNAPNPVPTPRRVMKFDPTLVTGKIPTLACVPSPFSNAQTGNGTNGVTIGADGTIFAFPTCVDGTGNTYVFGFPAQSVGAVAPTILDPYNESSLPNQGYPAALAFNGPRNVVFAEVGTFGNNPLVGFSATSNGQQPSVVVGTTCYQEFMQPPCGVGSFSFQPGSSSGFGIDANGFAYLPASWVDAATGDAANLTLPPAVLAVPVSASSSATVPQSALAGLNALAGGTGSPPVAAVVDGSTLYVLTGASSLVSADGLTNYYPGVSSCPPPSANAPVNTIFDPSNPNGDTPPSQCADGQLHLYLTAYTINASLLGVGVTGTDVDLVPRFVIGGDVVGGFGCSFLQGQFLAASAGYVYVINQQPNCLNNAAPEIDVYDTNGVTGVHTDIAPAVKINLASGFPSALFIGPSGTATGGQSVLRLPTKRGFRSTLYHWPPVRRPQSWRRRAIPVR